MTPERIAPRWWLYVLFWLGMVLPFLFLTSWAHVSDFEPQYLDRFVSDFLYANLTILLVLGALYIGRTIYKKKPIDRPLHAIGYGFGAFLVLLELGRMFLDGFSCLFLSYAIGRCTVAWVATGVVADISKNIVVSLVLAPLLFGVVWLFEKVEAFQKMAQFFRAYGIRLAVAVIFGWVCIVLFSLFQSR